MNRLERYMNAVDSIEYEEKAWNNFHKGDQQLWKKWAIRQRFVATVLKPYLKKEII